MPKGLSIIVGMTKPTKGMPKDEESSEELPDDGDPYSLAYDALKSGDKEAFAQALKSAVKECMEDD